VLFLILFSSCYQWAVNSDREDLLDKPVEQLSKFLLCADHFEPHCFINPKYKTAFSRRGQPVPTIFYNNLADFVPKSLKKSFELKNTKHQSGDIKTEFIVYHSLKLQLF
jgi:THAP domain.